MKLRRTAVIWMLGLTSLAVVACSSAATGDNEIGQSLEPVAAPGILVTDSGVTETGEPGLWFGAETVSVPETLAQLLGITAGERVAWVTPGGPSEGLLILGDTIVAVEGEEIDAPGGLTAALSARAEGESVTLSLLRGGENLDVTVTLVTRPAHDSTGRLAGIEGMFDRALSGEFRFLDRDGGEHTTAFTSGTLSGVNAGRVTLSRPGNGPMTVTLSPNVFVWIDGAPGTVEQLADATTAPVKVVTFDDVAVAVFSGGIIPPIFQALEGFLGTDGGGLLDALGALEMLQGLFGGASAPAPDTGL